MQRQNIFRVKKNTCKYIDYNQNEHKDNAKFGFKASVAIYDIN